MKNVLAIIAVIIVVYAITNRNCQTKTTTNKLTTSKTNKAMKEIIVDVRSIEEWNEDGHANCSVNYPLNQFADKIEELKKYDKVILVCRSGNRAGIAKAQLQSAGYSKEIENLGPWQNVTCKN